MICVIFLLIFIGVFWGLVEFDLKIFKLVKIILKLKGKWIYNLVLFFLKNNDFFCFGELMN